MISRITDCTVLTNGVKMPWFGLGVWRVNEGDEVRKSVASALSAGYRSIDTAAVYGNEQGVGEAVKAGGIARDQLFITTKVWNSDQGYETTLAAFDASLHKLDVDYVDLYLIHWPVKGKFKGTWKALEQLYRDGRVRAIGVSNFHIHHLQDLMADCTIKPMVNQVEFHPLLTQKPLLAFCKQQGIQMEAWSPLMQGNLDLPLLKRLGDKYGKSPAQIVLRWDLQNGVVTIPKSVTEHRIVENSQIFDFELSADDMLQIDQLHEDRRFGMNPDKLDE